MDLDLRNKDKVIDPGPENPDATPVEDIDEDMLAQTYVPLLRMQMGRRFDDPLNAEQMDFLRCLLQEMGYEEETLVKATHRYWEGVHQRKIADARRRMGMP